MLVDASAETGVVVEARRARSRAQRPGSSLTAAVSCGCLLTVPPQRAAVEVGKVLDVVEDEPVPAHQRVDRVQEK